MRFGFPYSEVVEMGLPELNGLMMHIRRIEAQEQLDLFWTMNHATQGGQKENKPFLDSLRSNAKLDGLPQAKPAEPSPARANGPRAFEAALRMANRS